MQNISQNWNLNSELGSCLQATPFPNLTLGTIVKCVAQIFLDEVIKARAKREILKSYL